MNLRSPVFFLCSLNKHLISYLRLDGLLLGGLDDLVDDLLLSCHDGVLDGGRGDRGGLADLLKKQIN